MSETVAAVWRRNQSQKLSKMIFTKDALRVVLPVNAFLIEHPAGRFLVDISRLEP